MKKTLASFAIWFKRITEQGMLLMAAALAAIILANSPVGHYYEIFFTGHIKVTLDNFSTEFTLHNLVNDLLMAFFFLIVGIEIKRELISGHLSTTKARILPVAAAIAGVITPALVYTFFNYGDEEVMRGWAIPTATDIAFALAVYTIFGKRLPQSLRVFLTALAIIDDLIAVLIIAIFYSSGISIPHVFAILALSIFIYFIKYKKSCVYLALGALLWLLFAESGIHATVAGVLLGFLIPSNSSKGKSPAQRVEELIHPFVVYFVLPVFAFTNSGVMIDSFNSDLFLNNVTLGIIAGLVIGKQLGIFSLSIVLEKMGLVSLPQGATYKQFYAVSILCGIGFTMSLFIGDLAFAIHPEHINNVKIGVLVGSFISAILGAIVFRFCK